MYVLQSIIGNRNQEITGAKEVIKAMEQVYQKMLLLGANGNERVYVHPRLKEALELGETVLLAGKELPVMIATENELISDQTADDIVIH